MNAKKKRDLNFKEIYGPVKQLMQICYHANVSGSEISLGKIEFGGTYGDTNYILTFNQNDKLTNKIVYHSSGISTELYDADGIHLGSSELDLAGNVKDKTTIYYTSFGKTDRIVRVKGDGSMYYHTQHYYNDKQLEIEHKHWNDKEEIINRVTREYDEKGNQILCLQYDKGDKLSTRSTAKWNEWGKQSEYATEWYTDRMQDESTRTVNTYNDRGDTILTVVYKMDGSVKRTYSYNPQYDSEGKKIIPPPEPDEDDEDREQVQEEKDSHGNWIKKTVFMNTVPVSIHIRQLSYYGEDDAASFVHPLSEMKQEEIKEKTRPAKEKGIELTNKQARWMAEAMNTTAENFQPLRYYVVRYRDVPSVIQDNGPHIDVLTLKDFLEEKMGARVVHQFTSSWSGWETIQRFTLGFRFNPYLVHVTSISRQNEEDFKIPQEISNKLDYNGYVYTGVVQLLTPSGISLEGDYYFEERVKMYIEMCTLKKKPEKPRIHMIEVKNNQFSMQEHPVNDNFVINDLDVNYGSGFAKFHDELMNRFHADTKGLVLFHGEPGTGKTYYIRHLLRKMTLVNQKTVIYIPPNMVDHMVEPAFLTFLSDSIQDWADQGFFSVLLIEDAEPLLAKRVEGVRIQGITNLLNMSDGLLNDALNLQIICTFNVDIKKLDSALLRPGRLIARKEFKPLSVIDANVLAGRLNIKHHFTEPASLAQIYAMQKNKETLVHDVEPDRDASTFIDDLI